MDRICKWLNKQKLNMISKINTSVLELKSMKKYPDELFFKGNIELLNRKKISIVGSRKPNQYARQLTHEIASKLARADLCIVSGGAIGTDVIAHKAAGMQNTIMVAGTGLDKHYPAVNKNVIHAIEKDGLVLSQFKIGTPSQRYNFPLRNELIVALGEVLIVMYGDENSGTMRSVEYAQKMGKEIYVLPHRIGESNATNKLLEQGIAKAIYDIDEFVKKFGSVREQKGNEFLEFCKKNPSYEEALRKFPNRVFEAELNGDIEVINAKIYLK